MITVKDEDLGFTRILKEVDWLNNHRLIVRINPKEKYENGLNVDDVAVWMEYGWDEFDVNYPSRPFFRSAIDANLDTIKKLFEKEFSLVMDGKKTGEQIYDSVGKFTVARIKEMILKGNFAPLAESTINQKGSSQPLIDTKKLYKSIEYVIEGVA